MSLHPALALMLDNEDLAIEWPETLFDFALAVLMQRDAEWADAVKQFKFAQFMALPLPVWAKETP
jgi:hypothetical protein